MKFRNAGSTATEFGILVALVVLLAVGGLMALRGSITNLLAGLSGRTAISNPGSIIGSNSPGGSAPGKGSSGGSVILQGGKGYMTLNLQSGGPVLQPVQSGGGAVTNATSVDGNHWNSIGTVMLGNTLQQMADQQSDPKAAAFLAEWAKYGFYSAQAQSIREGMPIVGIEQMTNNPQVTNPIYTPQNALVDLYTYQQQMMTLMKQPPPPSLSQADYASALAVMTDMYDIGQGYINQSGVSSASLASMQAGQAQTEQAATLIDYSQLKTQSIAYLQNQNIPTTPVKVTVTDSNKLDQASVSGGTAP